MPERISFLSCHAHNQLAVSWMKIWIAKETVLIGSRLGHPTTVIASQADEVCMCVYVTMHLHMCVSDAISHQNVASHFASLHPFSLQNKGFIIIWYPNHLILKIILLKNKEKEDLDNQVKTYCFTQCVILTHLFILSSFILCYFLYTWRAFSIEDSFVKCVMDSVENICSESESLSYTLRFVHMHLCVSVNACMHCTYTYLGKIAGFRRTHFHSLAWTLKSNSYSCIKWWVLSQNGRHWLHCVLCNVCICVCAFHQDERSF